MQAFLDDQQSRADYLMTAVMSTTASLQTAQDHLDSARKGGAPAIETKPLVANVTQLREQLQELQAQADTAERNVRTAQAQLARALRPIPDSERTTSTGNAVTAAQRIPNNLPTFKEGNNVNDFLDRFHNVLEAHALDLDRHWRRLIKICVPNALGNWIANNFKPEDSWTEAKRLIKGHLVHPAMIQENTFEACTRWQFEETKVYASTAIVYLKVYQDCELPDANPGICEQILLTLPHRIQTRVHDYRLLKGDGVTPSEGSSLQDTINLAIARGTLHTASHNPLARCGTKGAEGQQQQQGSHLPAVDAKCMALMRSTPPTSAGKARKRTQEEEQGQGGVLPLQSEMTLRQRVSRSSHHVVVLNHHHLGQPSHH